MPVTNTEILNDTIEKFRIGANIVYNILSIFKKVKDMRNFEVCDPSTIKTSDHPLKYPAKNNSWVS